MTTMAQSTHPIHLDRETAVEAPPKRSALHITLWVVQVLLALLFLWAGGIKLVLPLEQLAGPPGSVQLPGAFVRFIGVAELLGGLGLILPALLRIRPGLTPLAAAGPTPCSRPRRSGSRRTRRPETTCHESASRRRPSSGSR